MVARWCWRNGTKTALVKRHSSCAGRKVQQRRWWNDAAAAATKPSPPRCSGGEAGTNDWGTVEEEENIWILRGDARRRRMEEDALRGCERIWVFFNPRKPYCLG